MADLGDRKRPVSFKWSQNARELVRANLDASGPQLTIWRRPTGGVRENLTKKPGTFCFSRPLYKDQTAKLAFVEFGVLKTGDELWLECFDNQ